MELILHIGYSKTGTSAIQDFLYRNRKMLLRRYGILYPDIYIFDKAHHLFAWSLTSKPEEITVDLDPEHIFLSILDEAARTKSKIILISSEEFMKLEEF